MGPEHKPVKFPTFAMAAIAGIGDLPDTIMDRAVVIRMRKRLETEHVDDFRTRTDVPFLQAVRDRLADWLAPLLEEASDLVPPMPVRDRAADTWEPLVAVADLAGGVWPQRARAACRVMTDREKGNDQDRGLKIRILVDIRAAFARHGGPPALPTDTLLYTLNADPEAPWREHGPDGLTARRLQMLLTDYEVRSTNRRFPDGTQRRGYASTDFTDAWNRYCPAPEQGAATAPDARPPLEAAITEPSGPDGPARSATSGRTGLKVWGSGMPPPPPGPGTGPRR
jgi:hypothetical protein